jgi:hypothetical protein
MVNVRSTVLALVFLPLAFAYAGKRDAEDRLRWWLQQPQSVGGVFSQGKLDGVNYRKLLRGAVAYDRESLAAIFRYTVNGQLMGEGADTNCEILHLLLQYWGDSRFASVLAPQSQPARKKIIAGIEYDWGYPGWNPTEFPKTYKLAPHEKIATSPP